MYEEQVSTCFLLPIYCLDLRQVCKNMPFIEGPGMHVLNEIIVCFRFVLSVCFHVFVQVFSPELTFFCLSGAFRRKTGFHTIIVLPFRLSL